MKTNCCLLLLLIVLFKFATTTKAAPAWASNTIVQENSREKAEQLWELAIAAKGGRQRLNEITNLQRSVREKMRWGLKRVPNEEEAIYVFPGKSWEWEDRRGTIFGLGISLRNYEQKIFLCYLDRGKGSRCITSAGEEGSTNGHLVEIQLNYLMTTRWVRPVPVSVESGKVGGHKVDVVQTIVNEFPNGEKRVAFALDRETHLPRLVVIYTVISGQEYSGTVSLSDYVEIDGVQMPTKAYGVRNSYQLNVEYDPRVFEQQPLFERGIEAWKKRD